MEVHSNAHAPHYNEIFAALRHRSGYPDVCCAIHGQGGLWAGVAL